MDPQPSSFIPKKPLSGEPHAGGSGLLFSLGLLFFLLSLAAAGAAFGYTQYLNASIASKDESLKKTEDAFEPDTIETLVRTDRRIEEVKDLLGAHTAPSAVFALLSEITLASVQYTDFSYEAAEESGAEIELSGIADSFSSVALQSDQFGASKHLRDIVFSGITINEVGRVNFIVTATVEPAALSFAARVRDGSAQQPLPEPEPAPAGASSTTPSAGGGQAPPQP